MTSLLNGIKEFFVTMFKMVALIGKGVLCIFVFLWKAICKVADILPFKWWAHIFRGLLIAFFCYMQYLFFTEGNLNYTMDIIFCAAASYLHIIVRIAQLKGEK